MPHRTSFSCSPAEEEIGSPELSPVNILECITDGFIGVDRDWIVRYMNRAGEDYLGARREDVVGRNLWDVYPEAVRTTFYSHYASVMETSIPAEFEELYEPMNKWFDVRVCRCDGGLAIYFRDVTVRRQTESMLRRSEQQLRTLVDSIPVLVSYVDAEQRYRFTNDGYRQWFGHAREETAGRTICDVLGPAAYARIRDRVERALAGETVRYEDSVPYSGAGTRFVEATYVPDFDESGEVRGFFALILDISERRRLETEVLRISEEEQRRIGQDLHDEIGSLFTGISLMSQALLNTFNPGDDVRRRQVEKISDTAVEGVEKARFLAQGLNPVRLHGLGLSAALTDLARRIQIIDQVSCSCEIDGVSPALDAGTEIHLYRIAQEALNNALKYSCAKKICIRLTTAHDKLLLTVSDDGVGFIVGDEDAGMGLRIMRYRANLIGASFMLESLPGKGTTVACFLPRDNLSAVA